MSANLLMHAVRMVLNNLSDALKASVGPFLVGILILMLVAGAMGLPLSSINQIGQTNSTVDPTTMTPEEAAAMVSLGLFSLVAMVVYIVVASWVAVTWHRFILLAEYPSTVPSMAGKPIGAYIGRSIVLGLLLVVIAIPVFLVFGLLAGPLMAASPLLFGGLIGVLLGGILGFFWLRLGLTLPATAIGEKLGIKDSWSQTGPMSSVIFGVALLLMLLNFVIGLPGQLAGQNLVGALLGIAASWFTLMVGVGILTTLYGHIVEGRELN